MKYANMQMKIMCKRTKADNEQRDRLENVN